MHYRYFSSTIFFPFSNPPCINLLKKTLSKSKSHLLPFLRRRAILHQIGSNPSTKSPLFSKCSACLKVLTDHSNWEEKYAQSIRNDKLEVPLNYLSHFQGPTSQNHQKTITRRLLTSEVTLTSKSHFILFFLLRKVNFKSRKVDFDICRLLTR